MPRPPKGFGIEGLKLVSHLQKPATVSTRVRILLGVLLALASFLNALEVGR
jgi:hypothetical protein